MTALAVLLGMVVGTVLALTGAGGGVLAVPLLVLGLHLTVPQAVPLALLVVGLAAGLGAAAGWREGVVRYRAALLLGALAMVTAPLGVRLAHHLPPAHLLLASAAVLLWSAWRMAGLGAAAGEGGEATRPRPCAVNPVTGRLRWTAPCAWRLAATGLASGLLTGLLGVGGGFVIVPALTRCTDLDARSIAATSLAVIALAATAGLLGAGTTLQVPWPLSLAFGTAACAALLLVRRWSRHWPQALLRRGFAALCVAMAGVMAVSGAGQMHQPVTALLVKR